MLTISDLLNRGLLKVGEEIVFTRRSLKIEHRAQIQANGLIITEDGKTHRSPSGAAKHFTKKPIDGWHAWKVRSSQRTLANLRAQIKE